MNARTVPYGLWPSPSAAEDLAGATRLGDVQWDSHSETLVWLEGRSGRGVLVALTEGEIAPKDLTGRRSVRGKVGYGGGEFAVAGGHVYFAADDGRLYRQPLEAGPARPITPASGAGAAPAVSPDGKWVCYVHHEGDTDLLAVVDAGGRHWPQKWSEGADFYMQPCWSPDGTKLAWIEWDHPNMPWDATRLMVADVEVSGGLPRVREVRALVDAGTSAFQPAFSPDGQHLAYVDDPDGWWRLYLRELASGKARAISPEGVEAGLPAWVQGMRAFAFAPDGSRLVYLQNERGIWSVWSHELASGETRRVDALGDYTHFAQPSLSPRGRLVLTASSDRTPPRLVRVDPQLKRAETVRRSARESVPAAHLAASEPVTWPVGDEEAHGLFSRPTHPEVQGRGKPPLVVLVHGGPTSQRHAAYEGEVQFFATRGYAVLNVNYRGSTGYGRAYREALKGNWGLYDVEDCVAAVSHLAERGEIDAGKCVIMGGSAGGLTVLQALVTHPGAFKAGVCLYGVANQFTLVTETHKFESRYPDSLLGPLPEAADVYKERSPLFGAERIRDPLIVFQGAQDEVVPPSQSEAIVAALRDNGVSHEYHVYETEGHGFRRSETITDFYRKLENFLKRHVLFAP